MFIFRGCIENPQDIQIKKINIRINENHFNMAGLHLNDSHARCIEKEKNTHLFGSIKTYEINRYKRQ